MINMNIKTKMGLIGTGIVAVLAAGAGYISQLEDKWEQEYQEEAKKNVIRHSYELAQGYDVRLRKVQGYDVSSGKLSSEINLEIGKMDSSGFISPQLFAADRNGDGRVEEYFVGSITDNCKGDKDYRSYDYNMLLTALGKSTACEQEVALLRFANTDTLSNIERELLPHYGKDTAQKTMK